MKRTFYIFSIAIILSMLVSVIGLSPTPVQAAASWEHVGPAGFSEGEASNISLAFDNRTPYMAFMDGANGNRASVMKFDIFSGDWVYVGPAGFSSEVANFLSFAFDNSVPYVAYVDGISGISVKSFNGTDWVNVGPAWFSNAGAAYLSLAFDNGTPYVAFQDFSNGSKVHVMKFDSVSGNWVYVGQAGFSSGPAYEISLAIDNGTPYVAFRDIGNGYKLSVMKFNGTGWVYVGQAGFSGASVDYISLVFDNGIPYVAFMDAANGSKASVMKFDGTAWVNVGSAGFSNEAVYFLSFVLDNGIPYVAFKDGDNFKANVMKFDGAAWINVGPTSFSNGVAYSLSLSIDNGIPYVAFQDSANDNKASVMKLSSGFPIPPAAPLNLSAVADNPNQVTLDWLDNADTEQGFHIERCSGVNCTDFAWLTDVNYAEGTGLTVDYVDSGLTPGTSYTYRVAAFNQDGAGEYSNIDTAVTPTQGPLPPSNLTVTLLPNPVRAQLTWVDHSNNENQFRIWRSVDGGAFTQIGTINRSPTLRTATGGTVTFTNNDLIIGSTYSYYVTAANTLPNPDEFSIPSDMVSVIVPTVPAAPNDLAGSAVRNGNQDLVTLTWTDYANNEVGFQIQRSTSPNFATVSTFTVGPDVTTFSQNVSRTNDYYYRVRAGNAAGLSAWSNVVLVITP